MGSVMIVAFHRPDYSATGSTARLATVVEHFHARGLEVRILQVTRRWKYRRTLPVERRCVKETSLLTLCDRQLEGVVPKIIRGMARKSSRSSMLGMRKWILKYRPPASVREVVTDHLNRWQPDLVWVDHTWLAGLMTGCRPLSPAPWVCDTHDVLYVRDASRRQAGMDGECNITRDEEIQLLLPFDMVLAIQNDERRTLSEMLPGKQVITLRHPMDVRPQTATRPAVCFVGSKIDVNLHGLLAFVEQAWPEIRASVPEARLEVCGGVCEYDKLRQVAAASGGSIVLRGIVPQVADIYNGPAVSICPLWAGSGLKIKMVEAMAHGKAIVTTPVGSEGLEDGIDRAFVMAPTPRDFIEPVVRAICQPNYRLPFEVGAADYARRRFAPAKIWSEVDGVLDGWFAPRAQRRSA